MKNQSSNYLMQITKAESLIKKFENYGANFNPPSADISLKALKENLELNQKLAQEILESSNLMGNYQDAKNLLLKDISLKVKHIQLILKAIGLDEITLDRVKTITKNFRSSPKKKTDDSLSAEGNSENTPSSLDERIRTPKAAVRFAERKVEWLEQLVNYLTLVPSYQPNEPELSIAVLKTYIESAKQSIALWHSESENHRLLRIRRNEQIQNKDTGLITLCRKSMYYAKTLYGPDTKEAKELSIFVFTRN